MVGSIYLIKSPSDFSRQGKRVSRVIREARDDINKSKNELIKANSKSVSYEIDQLQSLYNKDEKDACSFDMFASKLEGLVSDIIETDDRCSKQIKANGKSHRVNNSLPKNLTVAAIGATFDTLGHKIDYIKETMKIGYEGIKEIIREIPFIGDAVEWISENYVSILQLGGAIIQIIVAGVAMAGAIAMGPIGIPLAIAAGISLGIGLDKGISGIFDISGQLETDGKSITQMCMDVIKEKKDNYLEILPSWVKYLPGFVNINAFIDNYDVIYDITDMTTSCIVGTGAYASLNKLSKVDDGFKYFQKIEKLENMIQSIKNTKIVKYWGYFGDSWNYVDSFMKDGVNGVLDEVSDGITSNCVENVIEVGCKDILLSS